ncbi:MAG: hypothetical protein HZA46_22120 [Planctomycetales bacterium]|nr:hypothetical protein [Planctomycetales bacterium]
MHGFLDELDQAFLTVQFGGAPLDFQIDTGFSGTLIVGTELFDPSCGTPAGDVKAELADEHTAMYDTFMVVVNWFDEPTLVRVMIGPGKLCLLGTDMLKPHRLEIDYGVRTVELTRNPNW